MSSDTFNTSTTKSCSSSSSSACSSTPKDHCDSNSYSTLTSICSDTSNKNTTSTLSSTCTNTYYTDSTNECTALGCSYSESSKSCPPILGKKKYIVSFKKTIYIDGKKTPILKVRRGYVYYFNVTQEKCHGYYENLFLLTKNSPCHCGKAPIPLKNSFDPVGNGCVKYHVTKHTPKYFYYQSATNPFIGGLVLVID